MEKRNEIDVKTLNMAMRRSVRRATRLNKALELDAVLVKGDNIVRISPDGNRKTLGKLEKSTKANGTIKPIKIG